jgi:hypothetical protein
MICKSSHWSGWARRACAAITAIMLQSLFRKEKKMKQIIVLLAMVILGIALSSMVLSFKDTAGSVTDNTRTKLESTLTFE